MPKKKETSKIAAAKKKNGHEQKWQEVIDKVGDFVKDTKKKYDRVDPATKKKMAAAALGALATVAMAFGVKKAVKKRK